MKYNRNTEKIELNQSETLGKWARRIGITYRTAWRWERKSQLPEGVSSTRMPSGTIMVTDTRSLRSAARKPPEVTVIYARVNPREPAADMKNQLEACRLFCASRGWTISNTVKERAPGVGSRRPKLAKLVEERPSRIVVAKPSVLSRFDFVFYEALWKNLGVQLVVVDRSADLGGAGGALADLTDAISLTCHKHYGFKRGTALVELLGKVIKGDIQV